MTVLDTSGLVDYLLALEAGAEVAALLEDEGAVLAPDLVVFEVLAVLRRRVGRGELSAYRAGKAVEDLGDLALDLVPSMALRREAWALRENLTVGDALFAALAGRTGTTLATKDLGLAEAAERHAGVRVLRLCRG